LCELRHDRDATIYRPDGHDGIIVHQATQHTIYQLWRRLVRLPSSRTAIAAPDDESGRDDDAAALPAARRRI
jgi:hypothetical protein